MYAFGSYDQKRSSRAMGKIGYDINLPALNLTEPYKYPRDVLLYHLLTTVGADIPHVQLAVHYAKVRLSINSSLRANDHDALFGCTSWNGYAYSVPSRWVVQSPGVINNETNKESR